MCRWVIRSVAAVLLASAAYAAFYDVEEFEEARTWGQIVVKALTTITHVVIVPHKQPSEASKQETIPYSKRECALSRLYGNEMPSLIQECQNPKHVAITIDDGISVYTEAISETLKGLGVPATFFLVASTLLESDSKMRIARKVAADHTIGSHSYNHVDLNEIPLREAEMEIKRSVDTIKAITGKHPTFFRAPYGYSHDIIISSITPATLSIIEKNEMKAVMWNCDTKDFAARSAEDIIVPIEEAIACENGLIVLMHDTSRWSFETLPRVIEILKQAEKQFVSIEECIRV